MMATTEEISPFQVITAIVGVLAVITAIIGLIGWFIRLEAKTGANKESTERIEKEQSESWRDFEAHRLNHEIHFDKGHSRTVQEGNEKQFARMEKDISEIKQMLMQLIKK
jgi:hypothetical protein